ncbi:universal stress protein [Nocardioides sp. JQ2195]|uniref:universal stress protein n=1 Tax=Nocardioides sp. JQ2195 TaxID=2592334 RepID=UPI00143ECDEF|nr:universal stress protein [Nocardioides sp. JQ2195]QIX26159.1 universal stress protein [Nocardioides sp. JQ2195]
MKPTIVVGYSPDEYGATGVERALEEARLRGARVLVANASRGDAYVDEHFASTAQLASLEEQLSSSGVDCEVRQSFGHDVAEQLLQTIEETEAILVVLGIRRRSPVGKLLMGSVAQRVLLGAECAVLLVKPPR